jgi:phage terminase small subunit
MTKAKTPRAGKGQHPKVKAGTSKASAEHRKSLFAKAMIANGGNKRAAAIEAGYKPGRAADKAAERLSQDVAVVAMIEASRNRALSAADVTVDRVLQEAARLALFDVRKLFNPDGTLKNPSQLDDDAAAVVAQLDVMEEFVGAGKDRVQIGFTKKVKLFDKNSALEKLMKHLGMYEKDNKQKADALGELLSQVDGAVLRPAGA